jgi:hypothetical protein
MNVKKLLQISLAGLLLVASAAYADCSRPKAPSVPDGSTATEAELVDAQTDVQEYMAATNAFLECLAQEEEVEPEVDAERIAAHNQAVDDMEEVAEQFNLAVRAWKAQSAE